MNNEGNKNSIDFKKLIWVFLFCSIIGYVIETSFYLLKNGIFMNKQGLLYGPIKPIYGVGGIIITLLSYSLKNKKTWLIFLFGSLFGGCFEYLCSVILEYVFGTSMWSYSHMAMNINGRVFIPYIPMWGLIAVAWNKMILPNFDKIYNKVPSLVLKVATIFVTIFLTYDILITSFAVKRMYERSKDVPSYTMLEEYLDKKYDDEYILKRIPYIKLVDKEK